MPKLDPAQIERLQKTVHEGAIIRDWCRHPAFKLFESWVNSKIEDKKQEWLRSDNKEEAERIRTKASTWLDVLDEFKRFMLSGDNAARLLQENAKEMEEENLVNNPPEN